MLKSKVLATTLLAAAIVTAVPATAQARPVPDPRPSAADLGPDHSSGLRHGGVINRGYRFYDAGTWF